MSLDATEIYERLVTVGHEWANLNAAAEHLEESKKTVLAEIANEAPEGSQKAKEEYALRHPLYKEHIGAMVEARRKANIAKVDYDGAKVWSELLRTQAANERAAMGRAT